ncbi:MAG: PsbP-related protein [Bacillota bacterium]
MFYEKKGKLALLLIITLFLSLVLLVGCSDEEDEVVLDEVYSTDMYQVEYSSDWHKDTQEQMGMRDVVNFMFDEDKQHETIGVVVEEEVALPDPKSYLESMELDMMFENYEEHESSSATLDEKEGHKIVYSGDIGENNVTVKIQQVMIIEEGRGYILTLGAHEDNFDDYMPYFEEVLASFELKD